MNKRRRKRKENSKKFRKGSFPPILSSSATPKDKIEKRDSDSSVGDLGEEERERMRTGRRKERKKKKRRGRGGG